MSQEPIESSIENLNDAIQIVANNLDAEISNVRMMPLKEEPSAVQLDTSRARASVRFVEEDDDSDSNEGIQEVSLKAKKFLGMTEDDVHLRKNEMALSAPLKEKSQKVSSSNESFFTKLLSSKKTKSKNEIENQDTPDWTKLSIHSPNLASYEGEIEHGKEIVPIESDAREESADEQAPKRPSFLQLDSPDGPEPDYTAQTLSKNIPIDAAKDVIIERERQNVAREVASTPTKKPPAKSSKALNPESLKFLGLQGDQAFALGLLGPPVSKTMPQNTAPKALKTLGIKPKGSTPAFPDRASNGRPSLDKGRYMSEPQLSSLNPNETELVDLSNGRPSLDVSRYNSDPNIKPNNKAKKILGLDPTYDKPILSEPSITKKVQEMELVERSSNGRSSIDLRSNYSCNERTNLDDNVSNSDPVVAANEKAKKLLGIRTKTPEPSDKALKILGLPQSHALNGSAPDIITRPPSSQSRLSSDNGSLNRKLDQKAKAKEFQNQANALRGLGSGKKEVKSNEARRISPQIPLVDATGPIFQDRSSKSDSLEPVEEYVDPFRGAEKKATSGFGLGFLNPFRRASKTSLNIVSNKIIAEDVPPMPNVASEGQSSEVLASSFKEGEEVPLDNVMSNLAKLAPDETLNAEKGDANIDWERLTREQNEIANLDSVIEPDAPLPPTRSSNRPLSIDNGGPAPRAPLPPTPLQNDGAAKIPRDSYVDGLPSFVPPERNLTSSSINTLTSTLYSDTTRTSDLSFVRSSMLQDLQSINTMRSSIQVESQVGSPLNEREEIKRQPPLKPIPSRPPGRQLPQIPLPKDPPKPMQPIDEKEKPFSVSGPHNVSVTKNQPAEIPLSVDQQMDLLEGTLLRAISGPSENVQDMPMKELQGTDQNQHATTEIDRTQDLPADATPNQPLPAETDEAQDLNSDADAKQSLPAAETAQSQILSQENNIRPEAPSALEGNSAENEVKTSEGVISQAEKAPLAVAQPENVQLSHLKAYHRLCSGVLNKVFSDNAGKITKKKQAVFFVLTAQWIYQFKDQGENQTSHEMMSISSKTRVSTMEDIKTPFLLQICNIGSDKALYVQAKDQAEMLVWLRAIKSASLRDKYTSSKKQEGPAVAGPLGQQSFSSRIRELVDNS